MLLKHWALGLSLFLALGCQGRKQVVNKTSQAEHAHPSEKSASPNPSSPARTKEEAIAAGIDFLSKAKWELDFVYLYSHLQPKYGWPNLPAQNENLLIQDSLRKNGDERALRILEQTMLFQRLIDPSFKLPPEMLGLGQSEDAYTVKALYCDQYATDSATYFPILRAEAALGDYRLTHALLACIWLDEHDCFSVDALKVLGQQVVAENTKLVNSLPDWIDLRIEAAALVQAAGVAVPSEWSEGVIKAQQADGGWLKDTHAKASETHATILALWLLAGSR